LSGIEKAEITLQGAEDLYKEIRIGNALVSASGETVPMKPGTEVDVTIVARDEAARYLTRPTRSQALDLFSRARWPFFELEHLGELLREPLPFLHIILRVDSPN
jgi:hypothetical protein